MRAKKAFTILEVTLACAIFSVLTVVLTLVLRQVSEIWRKTNAKDDAVRQLLRVRSNLLRDLANSSRKAGQFATARVGPNLGSGYDGDALTFLSSDTGQSEFSWNVDTTGSAQIQSQITYYLVIPNAPNPDGAAIGAGPPDPNGYEQQHPFKWLIRRVDPPPGSVPQVVDPNWTSWLTRPSSTTLGPSQRVIANQLLGFRVLQSAPLWTVELSAVGVTEARRKLALGSVPLASSPYTIVQRFSLEAHN